MFLKVIGIVMAMTMAVPVAASAAPASGLTAQNYITGTASVSDDAAPKTEKAFYRRFYGPRFGFYRRPVFGLYRRPFFGYYRRPFIGFYRRPFFRRRFFL